MIKNIMASLGFMPTSEYLARMSEMKSTDRAYTGLQEAFSEQMNESDNLKVKVRALETKVGVLEEKLGEAETAAYTRGEDLRMAKITIAELQNAITERETQINAREAFINTKAYIRSVEVRPVAGAGKVAKYELVLSTMYGEHAIAAKTVLRSLVASSKNKKLLEAEARGLKIVCGFEV